MDEPFLMIAKSSATEVVIKKSRFICSIARATSDEEAQEFIKKIQDENRKATHNCFAYMVGDKDQIQRESDNGEPSGTAGVPILESLKMANLHNVVAVVTRYFGGIKLGAGGLIRAYSNTTTEAIRDAGIIQRVSQLKLDVTVSYSLHDSFVYYLNEEQIAIDGEQYGVNVITSIFVNEDEADQVIANLTTRFNDQLTIEKAGTHFHEIAYQPE
ncbi:MAG: YigZ family protein [Limosilactobacillus sp.]|uniref:YigZ family protein n=1 Tax=Limosilactobacillus sp. TaxID=2773925 RepID=UPI002707F638|nr:YigZ family protein [Limosilactobacillus sp.]